VGYWEWDLETNVVVWSDETYRIFGLKPQERPMDLAAVRGMVHPDDREALYGGVDVGLDAGVHPVAEFRIVTPSGEVRTVHAITSKLSSARPGDPANGASGRARRLFGTVQDITELKHAEETRHALSRDLQESKAWLEEAQRVAHLGYWVWDLETNQVIWSEETYRIFGLVPQAGSIDIAIVGEMFHPDDREAVFRIAEEAIRLVARISFAFIVAVHLDNDSHRPVHSVHGSCADQPVKGVHSCSAVVIDSSLAVDIASLFPRPLAGNRQFEWPSVSSLQGGTRLYNCFEKCSIV
jgi:PAS domain S-box-containing protein